MPVLATLNVTKVMCKMEKGNQTFAVKDAPTDAQVLQFANGVCSVKAENHDSTYLVTETQLVMG